MQKPIEGKIAVVTGAGSLQGIGAAVSLELARQGADIFFTYWTPYHIRTGEANDARQDIVRLEKRIREMDVQCFHSEVNLAEPDSFPLLFNQVNEKLGSADILVNNACFSANDSFETITAELLDRHYEINVRAPVMLSAEFAKRFQGEAGRIIQLTSGQSKGPMMGELSYAATKGAVEALVPTLAAELGYLGITVNAVNPGPTDTGWITPNIKEHLLPKFPLGRIGEPEDAARIIAFLAGPDSAWITGQVIHSEGGFIRN